MPELFQVKALSLGGKGWVREPQAQTSPAGYSDHPALRTFDVKGMADGKSEDTHRPKKSVFHLCPSVADENLFHNAVSHSRTQTYCMRDLHSLISERN
jgi:hypothetical protein